LTAGYGSRRCSPSAANFLAMAFAISRLGQVQYVWRHEGTPRLTKAKVWFEYGWSMLVRP
jgi:hypothetical protein